jgi:hypothetical protein
LKREFGVRGSPGRYPVPEGTEPSSTTGVPTLIFSSTPTPAPRENARYVSRWMLESRIPFATLSTNTFTRAR